MAGYTKTQVAADPRFRVTEGARRVEQAVDTTPVPATMDAETSEFVRRLLGI